jgi:hypothetical protein
LIPVSVVARAMTDQRLNRSLQAGPVGGVRRFRFDRRNNW